MVVRFTRRYLSGMSPNCSETPKRVKSCATSENPLSSHDKRRPIRADPSATIVADCTRLCSYKSCTSHCIWFTDLMMENSLLAYGLATFVFVLLLSRLFGAKSANVSRSRLLRSCLSTDTAVGRLSQAGPCSNCRSLRTLDVLSGSFEIYTAGQCDDHGGLQKGTCDLLSMCTLMRC